MTMTIEDIRDILNGFVDAGMGGEEFQLRISNKDYIPCAVESASIYRNGEGDLVPRFSGWMRDES